MDILITGFLLGFGVIFGFVFEDILNWFGFKVTNKDMSTIVLFFPAFFFLLGFWLQPLFLGSGFLADITKISTFYDGLFLYV